MAITQDALEIGRTCHGVETQVDDSGQGWHGDVPYGRDKACVTARAVRDRFEAWPAVMSSDTCHR